MSIKLKQDEVFKIVGFVKKVYGYLKTDATTKVPFYAHFNKGKVYARDINQRKFSLKLEFHISEKTKKTIPNFYNFLMNNEFTIDLKGFFDEAKNFKKVDIIEGELDNNTLYIKYNHKETGEETTYSTTEGSFDRRMSNEIDKKFKLALTVPIINDSILLTQEEYKKNKGHLRIKQDEDGNDIVVCDKRKGKPLSDIPGKFLTKLDKSDTGTISTYRLTDDAHLLIFTVKSSDFTTKQIFTVVPMEE